MDAVNGISEGSKLYRSEVDLSITNSINLFACLKFTSVFIDLLTEKILHKYF